MDEINIAACRKTDVNNLDFTEYSPTGGHPVAGLRYACFSHPRLLGTERELELQATRVYVVK